MELLRVSAARSIEESKGTKVWSILALIAGRIDSGAYGEGGSKTVGREWKGVSRRRE